jgi:hypothetical protein
MDDVDFELTPSEREQKRKKQLSIQKEFFSSSRVPEIKSRWRRYDGDIISVEGYVMDQNTMQIQILYILENSGLTIPFCIPTETWYSTVIHCSSDVCYFSPLDRSK